MSRSFQHASGQMRRLWACLALPACTPPATVMGAGADSTCSSRPSQYSMVAGAGRENGMETSARTEWRRPARPWPASAKRGRRGSSAKASSNGPVASAQVRVVPEGLGTLSGGGAQGVLWDLQGRAPSDAPRALEWGCLVCLLVSLRPRILISGVQPEEGEVPGWDGRGGGSPWERQTRAPSLSS